MFTSSVDVTSGTDFSALGEDDEFTLHQFHVKVWVARYFEEHVPAAMHIATGRAVPLTWLIFDSQSTVDLIANPKCLLNIRRVRSKDAIHVHCNSRVKIVHRDGDFPGYVTVWYESKGIANILSMSRATKKFRVVFGSKGGNFSGWSSRTGR